MVTSEVSQLTGECNAWIDNLKKYRHEFTELNEHLPSIAGRQTNKDILLEIEHLHNQLHIQLVNIHDLKQKIKMHNNLIALEKAGNNGRIPESLLQRHEELFDEYQTLENMLSELKSRYSEFLKFLE